MKLVGWLILALLCLHTRDAPLIFLLSGVLIGVAVAPRR